MKLSQTTLYRIEAVAVAAAALLFIGLASARAGEAPPPTAEDCIAETIYWEARGEPLIGQMAVACGSAPKRDPSELVL